MDRPLRSIRKFQPQMQGSDTAQIITKQRFRILGGGRQVLFRQ
jgi:hypothetical protein